ncbi:MAG: rod shape-determining protein MreC [Treponema sp.]|jgi:rod shape-determining protein MreC|nr:rod shape-determining protein MreC [Treponema sp.]
MIFTKGRKPKKRFTLNIYVFVVLTVVSFVMLALSSGTFILNFRNIGLSAFSGIRSSVDAVSSFVSRTVLSVKELATLREQYDELSSRISRYEQLERSSAEIRQENIRLKEQLGFSESIIYRHIPAKIIGRDPDNLYSAFVINKGSRDGIQTDMPVIAFQDGMQALVGKVVQAGFMESLIIPLYDISSYVSARFSESRYEGIVEGQGRFEAPLLMRFVRRRAGDEIQFGDMVKSSGMGRLYPAEINIGRVAKVLVQESENTIDVEIEPSIDFSRLEYVFVIITEGAENKEENNG